jgi:peptide/nickel transport system permease protein
MIPRATVAWRIGRLPEVLARRCVPRRRLMALVGTGIAAVFLGAAIVLPIVLNLQPTVMHHQAVLAAPSAAFPFGTDELGRDIFSRVLFGMRISFLVGSMAVVVGGGFGVACGLLAGYFGGLVDVVVMRFLDVMQAFPGALFGIVAAAAMGPGVASVVVATAFVGIPFFSRIVRAKALVEKELEYIQAARSMGAGAAWILRRHVLPNVTAPVSVQASNAVGQAILLEATLSFLGLGIQPPTPSLGTMLFEAKGVLGLAPWYPVFPGIALVILVVALNFISDGLAPST